MTDAPKEEDVLFLVLVIHDAPRPRSWSQPCFVRAADVSAAYRAILEKRRVLFENPRIRLECFVIGEDELPDSKNIARAWWKIAQQNAGNAHKTNDDDFEAAWDEHGSLPEEEP